MDNFLGRNDGQMQCRGILHIVKTGDTLYKIGKKYGAPVSRIMYANPYINVYNLQPGDEICVPVMTPRNGDGNDSGRGQKTEDRRMENRNGDMLGDKRRMEDNEDMPGNKRSVENRNEDMLGDKRHLENGNAGAPERERRMEDSNMGMPVQTERAGDRNRMMPVQENCGREQNCAMPWENRDEDRNMVMPVRESRMENGNRSMPVRQNPAEDRNMTVPSGERRMEDRGMGMPVQKDFVRDCRGRDSMENGKPCRMEQPVEGVNPPMMGFCPNEPCEKMNGMMPWDSTGVSESMMEEYLAADPKQNPVR